MSALFPPDLIDDAKSLLEHLRRRSIMMATAESCTGGLLAGLLTEVAGASISFERGFVTYSDASKTEMLGVDAAAIGRYGAVSREVARAMAEGALSHARASVAVSITGIAGPDGGSAEKPIGLVCFAVACGDVQTIDRECRFGDLGRTGIRLASVREALSMLLEATA